MGLINRAVQDGDTDARIAQGMHPKLGEPGKSETSVTPAAVSLLLGVNVWTPTFVRHKQPNGKAAFGSSREPWLLSAA